MTVDTTPTWTPPAHCECWAFPNGRLCSYCELAKKRAGQMAAASASHTQRERADLRTDPVTPSDLARLNTYPGEGSS